MNTNLEEALFALAMSKPAAKRAAWLDAECEGDSALRQRLDALLSAHDKPDELLPEGAPAAVPTIKLDLAEVPDEAVGQTLRRYKLLERVGEGGCGVVYTKRYTCGAPRTHVSSMSTAYHSVALKADGSIVSWGMPSGAGRTTLGAAMPCLPQPRHRLGRGGA